MSSKNNVEAGDVYFDNATFVNRCFEMNQDYILLRGKLTYFGKRVYLCAVYLHSSLHRITNVM